MQLNFENTLEESEWMLNTVIISALCFDLKKTTWKLVKRTDPTQLSDIRYFCPKWVLHIVAKGSLRRPDIQ